MDLADLTVATFEPHEGETFAVTVERDVVELTLTAAGTIGAWPSGRDPFRLEFRGPCEPLLGQATRRLEHPALGALEIFLVPLGQDQDGTTYEAIFT